jgi:hypothetical protein
MIVPAAPAIAAVANFSVGRCSAGLCLPQPQSWETNLVCPKTRQNLKPMSYLGIPPQIPVRHSTVIDNREQRSSTEGGERQECVWRQNEKRSVPEGQMKVAPYFSAGFAFQRSVRPGGDDRKHSGPSVVQAFANQLKLETAKVALFYRPYRDATRKNGYHPALKCGATIF